MADLQAKEYYELRDGVWVYGREDWGIEKDATRDYLKKIWMNNNYSNLQKVDTTRGNVAREAIEILTWWWGNHYQADAPLDPHAKFGRFLYTQYQDSLRVELPDNVTDDPLVVPRKITDTYCYCQ